MRTSSSPAVMAAALALAAPAAAQASFPAGTTVLGSPAGIESGWKRCVIVAPPPTQYDWYEADCADEGMTPRGLEKYVRRTKVKPQWVKPNDPGFRPDMQVGAVAAAEARAKAAPKPVYTRKPDGPARAVALGRYECYAGGFGAANLGRGGMNFSITGPGAYRMQSGGGGGFSFNPATKAMVFSGPLKAMVPANFTIVYREPQGRPSVSFRNASGNETFFCDRV